MKPHRPRSEFFTRQRTPRHGAPRRDVYLIAAASRADGLRSLPPAAWARRPGGGFFVDFLVGLALLAALALSWHGIAAQLAHHHASVVARPWSRPNLADIKAAS